MKSPTTQGLTLTCFLLLHCLSSAAQDNFSSRAVNEPLPVETASSAKSFASVPIDLSPDGLLVAYTLSDPRRRKVQGRPSDLLSIFTCTGAPHVFADSDVFVTNTQTGQTATISAGKGANWGPSWSPDGKSLAFYSDRSGKAHIWIWQKATGKLRPLTTAFVHVRSRLERILWTPDSKQVITKILGVNQTLDDCFDGNAAPRPLNTASRVIYEIDSSNKTLPASTISFLADLAVIDVATGKLKRIVRQDKIVAYSLSSTGDKIAFATPYRPKPNDEFLFVHDLKVVSLLDRRVETVPDFLPGVPSLPASWSQDGNMLAFISGRDCFIWRIDAGRPQKVTSSPQTTFGQAPLFDKEGQYLYLLSDNRVWKVSLTDAKATPVTERSDRQLRTIISRQGGSQFRAGSESDSLYVTTHDPQSKRDGFYRVNLSSGRFNEAIERDSSDNLSLSAASPNGDFFVFASQDAQHQQNLWVAGRNFADPRQLTHINPELERYTAGAARLIDYSDADGKNLRATLLMPTKYQRDRRYPLIVWVYGGSMLSANVNRYGSAPSDQNMQLFSSRGYAVLLPDSPLRTGTPMQDLIKTVLPAVDKTIEMGVTDPERLGIMGLSYGGYSTLALLVQTKRFKAALMDVGFGNMITSYGVMLKNGMPLGVGWAEEGQGRMGGPPWEFPDRYVQNSPVFYLDKIETPLLITQGGMDVSPYQSDEIFVGLRRLGKKVVYVRYENEGHGIELYDNKVDYWSRVIKWFGSHLNSNSPSQSGTR